MYLTNILKDYIICKGEPVQCSAVMLQLVTQGDNYVIVTSDDCLADVDMIRKCVHAFPCTTSDTRDSSIIWSYKMLFAHVFNTCESIAYNEVTNMCSAVVTIGDYIVTATADMYFSSQYVKVCADGEFLCGVAVHSDTARLFHFNNFIQTTKALVQATGCLAATEILAPIQLQLTGGVDEIPIVDNDDAVKTLIVEFINNDIVVTDNKYEVAKNILTLKYMSMFNIDPNIARRFIKVFPAVWVRNFDILDDDGGEFTRHVIITNKEVVIIYNADGEFYSSHPAYFLVARSNNSEAPRKIPKKAESILSEYFRSLPIVTDYQRLNELLRIFEETHTEAALERICLYCKMFR